MADVDENYPLQDSKDALQAESGNPVDFPLHPTMRMPTIEVQEAPPRATEGSFSPVHGTIKEGTPASGTAGLGEDAEAARNRALKQGMAGL